MRKLPTLKQLHHLVTLYDYQHFGRAAEACFISQSTMSSSIGQLEALLEVQLIEREHKKFFFTQIGENFAHKSRALITGVEELVDYAKHDGMPMHGTLRLGCIPTIAPFIVSLLLNLCQESYPQLKLHIREDTSDNLLHALEIGQIELILLALPYPTKNLEVITLCQDPFHLVLPPEWQRKITGKDMQSWPDESIFLLEKEHCLTGHALQACAIKNRNKINPFFATSLHTLTQMVNSGLGVSIFPELAIKSGILNGTSLITMPLSSEAYREVGIAWRAASHKHESYLLIAELIKKIISGILK